jgi:hypothetical protein
MDVLEERFLATDVNFLYDVLQLGNNPIRLVGTGSMASQYYPADYDFLTLVKNKYTPLSLYNDFNKILNKIDNSKLYFIEFKIQQELKKGQKEQEKQKVYTMDEITPEFFLAFFKSTTELCKIDCILWNEGKFKEVSCIYFFSKKAIVIEDYIKALLDDQKYYYDEGKIYKSLKRLMLSAKYETPADKNLIIAITRFFNSMVGKLYELDNMLQACIIYMRKYGADKRVKLFIKNIGLDNMNPDKLVSLSKDYQKIINDEAMKFYEHYNLPVGHLPSWNSIKPKIQL